MPSSDAPMGPRDKEILALVSALGCVARPTLQRLFFPTERRAQRVLQRLTESGHLRRSVQGYRAAIYRPTNRRPTSLDPHTAAVADAILRLRPQAWQREYPLPGVRGKSDALLQLQSGRWLWLEVERRHGYAAKKVHLYRLCCQRKAWARYFPAFPDLLLVGVGKRAQEAAREAMQGEHQFRLVLGIEEVEG